MSAHPNGEPCDVGQMVSFGGDHFLNDDSNTFDPYSTDNSNDTSSNQRRSSNVRKTNLGSNCPVCDQVLHKQHARDHVCWHFMDELKALISDPTECPDPGCDYKGEKMENTARHLALFHSKLDEYLSNKPLLAEKRVKALTKPKKVWTIFCCKDRSTRPTHSHGW